MFKKGLAFLMTFIIVFATLSVSVYGEAEELVIKTTKEERDAIFEKAISEIMAEITKEDSVARGPKYHYKTEYAPYVYKTLSGYAGNQLEGGYKFPTGGGFWFTDSGGPSVSGSINVSLPAPYNIISVSVNLSKKGTSGLWVSVPSSSSHYKLYVSKEIQVRPYVIYRARVGTENWEVYEGGGVPIVYSIEPSAKKV